MSICLANDGVVMKLELAAIYTSENLAIRVGHVGAPAAFSSCYYISFYKF